MRSPVLERLKRTDRLTELLAFAQIRQGAFEHRPSQADQFHGQHRTTGIEHGIQYRLVAIEQLTARAVQANIRHTGRQCSGLASIILCTSPSARDRRTVRFLSLRKPFSFSIGFEPII